MMSAPPPPPEPGPLRGAYRLARDLGLVARGYAHFRARGETPPAAYAAMRRLYSATDGRFNDAVARVAGWVHPPRPIEPAGLLLREEIEAALGDLRRDGYHVFPRRLGEGTVDELVALAHTLPCAPTTASDDGSPRRGPPRPWSAARGTSPRHDFDMAELCAQAPVQSLMADPSLRALAAGYLGSEPILDLVAMWWSEPGPQGRDLTSEAAQRFHFDMDWLKFVKIFFYLSDVDTHTGPHCLIRRSHRRKPRAARRDGRHSDASLAALYRADDFVEVTGPRGTILAVDTRAFHKGKPVERDARLLLQLEFAVSLFGQNYPRVALREVSPALERARAEHPRTFSMFTSASRSRS